MRRRVVEAATPEGKEMGNRLKTRALPILWLGSACLWLAACGGLARPVALTQGPGTATAMSTSDSPDGDSDAGSHDDQLIAQFGQPAPASMQRDLSALVRRYYKAAARLDGATACSMLSAFTAQELTENSHQQAGPHGHVCARVLGTIFARERHRLVNEAASLNVAAVRTDGRRSVVLLHFATTPAPHHIALRRSGSRWSLLEVQASAMP